MLRKKTEEFKVLGTSVLHYYQTHNFFVIMEQKKKP